MSLNSISPENEETQANTEIDAVRYGQFMDALKSEQNLLMAVLGGLAASVVAAVLWAAITYATNYQIGFMAIGVGFLVGFVVRYLGKGISISFGIVGAAFALFGCLLGNLLTTVIVASQLEGSSLSMVLSTLLYDPTIVFEVIKATFSPIDLLFYGIAVYEGYKFSFRQISEEELASLQKLKN